eukprot:PLAT7378.1.p1 GENE.PLAT7378.1~~PLAT7378.1.p1  ORF type:complete len:571 (-),score=237.17 PLAT7378.1:61-1773(-)
MSQLDDVGPFAESLVRDFLKRKGYAAASAAFDADVAASGRMPASSDSWYAMTQHSKLSRLLSARGRPLEAVGINSLLEIMLASLLTGEGRPQTAAVLSPTSALRHSSSARGLRRPASGSGLRRARTAAGALTRAGRQAEEAELAALRDELDSSPLPGGRLLSTLRASLTTPTSSDDASGGGGRSPKLSEVTSRIDTGDRRPRRSPKKAVKNSTAAKAARAAAASLKAAEEAAKRAEAAEMGRKLAMDPTVPPALRRALASGKKRKKKRKLPSRKPLYFVPAATTPHFTDPYAVTVAARKRVEAAREERARKEAEKEEKAKRAARRAAGLAPTPRSPSRNRRTHRSGAAGGDGEAGGDDEGGDIEEEQEEQEEVDEEEEEEEAKEKYVSSKESWIPVEMRLRSLRRSMKVAAEIDSRKKALAVKLASASKKEDVDMERQRVLDSYDHRKTKRCALCEYPFGRQLPFTVTYKAIMDLRDSWSRGKEKVKPNLLLAKPPRCYDQVHVCIFCPQFFMRQSTYRPTEEQRRRREEMQDRQEREALEKRKARVAKRKTVARKVDLPRRTFRMPFGS